MSLEIKRIKNSIRRRMLPKCEHFLYDVQGHRLLLNSSDGISKSLYYQGVYHAGTTEYLKHNLARNEICVDVGANIGYLTLIMARYAGKVYAFEPDPRSRAILRYNIRLNGYDNVTVRPEAVSDCCGFARFYQNVEPLYSGLVPHNGIDSVLQVETVTLDSIMEWASLVKIDVEGAEAAVLRGMKRLLSECPRLRLILEVEPDRPGAMPVSDIFDILEGWNMRSLDRLNVLFWRDSE